MHGNGAKGTLRVLSTRFGVCVGTGRGRIGIRELGGEACRSSLGFLWKMLFAHPSLQPCQGGRCCCLSVCLPVHQPPLGVLPIVFKQGLLIQAAEQGEHREKTGSRTAEHRQSTGRAQASEHAAEHTAAEGNSSWELLAEAILLSLHPVYPGMPGSRGSAVRPCGCIRRAGGM